MFKTIKRRYWYLFKRIFVSTNAVCDVCGKQIKRSNVKVCSQSRLEVEQGAIIEQSTILLHEGAVLKIGKNAVIRYVKIDLRDAELGITDNVKIEGSSIIAFKQSTIRIGNSSFGKHVEIIAEQSRVDIGNKVKLSNWKLMIEHDSSLNIGEAVVCEQGNYWCGPEWSISQGALVTIDHHNRLRNKFWVRFGAQVKIGSYNCINEGSEIRADERIEIGSYNMVSYNCRIWDTDTHCFYKDDTRRKMTEDMYPNIGVEKDKPKTKPITIGDDCLIGEGAVVLKGCEIGNKVKVGTRVIVSNIQVPDNSTVVGDKGKILKG